MLVGLVMLAAGHPSPQQTSAPRPRQLAGTR
jgi:hypothetical protein